MPIVKWSRSLVVSILAAIGRQFGLRADDKVGLHADGLDRNEALDQFPEAFRKARGTVDPTVNLEL